MYVSVLPFQSTRSQRSDDALFTGVFYYAWSSGCFELCLLGIRDKWTLQVSKTWFTLYRSPVAEKPRLSIMAALGWNLESTPFRPQAEQKNKQAKETEDARGNSAPSKREMGVLRIETEITSWQSCSMTRKTDSEAIAGNRHWAWTLLASLHRPMGSWRTSDELLWQ